MSAESFCAAVDAGKVPTRTELLDARDALCTQRACMLSEPGSAGELRAAREAAERAIARAVDAEQRNADLAARLARVLAAANGEPA